MKRKTVIYLIIAFLILILPLYQVTRQNILETMYPFRYKDIIYSNSARYELDPFLVAAVIREESKFNAQAVSKKGAVGLMQIMPSTGEWIAEQMGHEGYNSELLSDEALNIEFGTWYLRNLMNVFDDDIPKVLAAYNGGRGKVNEWLVNEIWDGSYANRSQIPYKETRNFMERVALNYKNYRKIYTKNYDETSFP